MNAGDILKDVARVAYSAVGIAFFAGWYRYGFSGAILIAASAIFADYLAAKISLAIVQLAVSVEKRKS